MNDRIDGLGKEDVLLADLRLERRRVRDGRHQWVDTVDAILDPIMVHDGQGCVVRANRAYARLSGIGFPEIIGRPYWECFPRRGGPLPGCVDAACACGGVQHEVIELADGEVYSSRVFALRDDGSGLPRALHLFKNVSQERSEAAALLAQNARAVAQAEALGALAASKSLAAGDVDQLAREMTELVARTCSVARVNVWLFNADETALHCVDHFDTATRSHAGGMELRQEHFEQEFRALKMAPYVAADHPLTDPRTAGYVEAYLKPNRITSMLDVVVHISGRHLGLLCLEHVDQPHHWESDEIAFAQQASEKIAIALANRDTNCAEQALRDSERRFRGYFELGLIGMAITLPDRGMSEFNDEFCRILGRSREELARMDWASITHPDDLAADLAQFNRLLSGEIENYSLDKRFVRGDGTIVHTTISVTCARRADRSIDYLMVLLQDITERKVAERELRASRDLLWSIVEHAPVRVFWKDAELRYMGCNSLFARDAGLSRSEDVIGKDDFQMSWGAQAELYRADDRAVIDGNAPKIGIEEPQTTPDGRTIWLRTSKVPLHNSEGRSIGVLGIYEDITDRHTSEAVLRRSLEGTIDAVGATMESRDPYTAGHQRRVAGLAAAIATEMGLPPHTVEGIHFGALVHDLGKIHVPAEILSKPSRLSTAEFELIKTHPQAGYDIIKGVEFPWPIALMVLQHHERLDGTGYPQGLKGHAIALEARILAVADVVEAMATHRPYRPGLGVDAALKEVESKKGTWFDPDAVDACLRLFREKGFSLEKSAHT